MNETNLLHCGALFLDGIRRLLIILQLLLNRRQLLDNWLLVQQKQTHRMQLHSRGVCFHCLYHRLVRFSEQEAQCR